MLAAVRILVVQATLDDITLGVDGQLSVAAADGIGV